MLLKAGTYRFNDVLNFSSLTITANNPYNIDIVFKCVDSIEQFDSFVGMLFQENSSEIGLSYVGTDGNMLAYAVPLGGWVNNIHGLTDGTLQNIDILKDTEVDDAYGTWFISNTNYNEVNPTEDKEYIEVASWYTRVANAIRSKKGTTSPILRDDFASEIESISVGSTLPVYDGTVIIEKAESVLGLRRFKENVTPIGELTSDPNQYINEIYFNITPFEVEGEGLVDTLSCAITYNNNTYLIYKTTDGFISLAPFETILSIASEINVLSTANSTVDEWLLANTEGVSV